MGWVINTTPRPLYARERPGTHFIGGWVDPQGRSGRVRKISPPPGFDPRTVQRVAIQTELPRPTGIIILYYNLMGPPSYMRYVFDRNVVKRRMTVPTILGACVRRSFMT
jgi:hypothetical protein